MIIWLYYGKNEIRDYSRPRSRTGPQAPQGPCSGGGEGFTGQVSPTRTGKGEQEPYQAASWAYPSTVSLDGGGNQGVLRHYGSCCGSVGYCSKIRSSFLAGRDGGMKYEKGGPGRDEG